jgi:hypothetical protein
MTLFQGPLCFIALALGLVTAASAAEWQPNRRTAEPRYIPAPLNMPAVSDKPLPAAQAKTGILVRNPNAQRGEPEFALLDSYGRVKRYVEGSERVSLNSYVGKQVRILHDTGKTLLASQLELPLSSTRRAEPQQASAQQTAHYSNSRRRMVRLAAEEIPMTEKTPIVLEDVLSDAEKRGAAMGMEELPPVEGGMSHQAMSGPMMGEGSMQEEAMYGPDMSGEFVEDQFIPYGEGGCPNCQSGQCSGGQCSGGAGSMGSRWGGGECSCGRCQKCTDYLSCQPGSRGQFYGRAEWLLWWFDEMYIPPLVTGSTVNNNEGVLGLPGTTILYGDEGILGGSRNGLRLSLGMTVDQKRDIALQADYLSFETESESFTAGGLNGSPIVGRPFFDLVPLTDDNPIVFGRPQERAEQVNFPNGLEGDVTVTSRSEFESLGIHLRKGICCRQWCQPCGCDQCNGQLISPNYGASGGGRGVSRIDFLGGYRYVRLAESINIVEDLNVIQTPADTFIVHDGFATSNVFQGADLGFQWSWESPRWGFEFLSKLALGTNRQRADVNGSTTFSDDPNPAQGGLLALSSNIGTYERNQFAVVPEIGARTFYRLTPRLRATAGYTLLYFSNVVRPGDQIVRDINGTLVPSADLPTVDVDRPLFPWRTTDLFAHGLNVGLDYRF